MPSNQPPPGTAIPSAGKMRRMSRARAPMQRRTPISRVRSRTLIVIALISPTMLIATTRRPSTAIAELICRLELTFSCWLGYLTIGPTAWPLSEPRRRRVDQRMVAAGRLDEVAVDGRGAQDRLCRLQGHVEVEPVVPLA